jgi:PAS domain S-box-containing protein
MQAEMLKRARDRIRAYYVPPAYEGDPEQVRRARILYSTVLGLEIAIILQVVFTCLLNPTALSVMLPALAVIPLMVILRYRIKPANVERLAFLLVVGLFSLTFMLTIQDGGIRSPAYAGLTILTLLTGLLLGFRSAIMFALASLFGGTLLVLLDAQGVLPLHDSLSLPSPVLLTNFTYMLVGLTILYLGIRDIRQAYRDGQKASLESKHVLSLLRKSESQYRAIVEDQTELINRYDASGTILYVNDAYARLYNQTPETMIGRKQSEFLDEATLQVLAQIKSALTVENPVVTGQHTLTNQTGEVIWLEWRDRGIFNDAGEPIEYQGVGRDITEQKHAELALLESEEKFRTLSDKSPNMIFINQAGKIIYVNEACVEIMGYSKEQFYADDFSFKILIAPESLPLILENFETHARGEEIPPYEADLITRDGRRLIAIHATRLITIDRKPAILGIMTDVTSRRASEEALIRLNKAVDSSGEVIFMTDPEGVLTYVNPRFTQIYGYQPEEVIGQATPRILSSGLMPPEVYEDFWSRIRRGEIFRAEFINQTRSGRIVPVEISVNPIKNESGEITGFLAAQRDISERRAMEEELRASEELYRAVAESAFVGIGISDAEEKLSYVNPTFAQMLGYSQEEMQGRPITDFMNEAAGRTALSQSALRRDTGHRNQYELPMLRKDGSERLMQVSASPLLNESGKFESILAVVTDLTEQRAADRELRRQVNELSTLQTVASACAMSLDEDEIIERVTRIVSTLFYPDHVGVLLMDGEQQALRVHPSYHGLPPDHYQDLIPLGTGVAGGVVSSGLPLRIADVRAHAKYITSTPGIRSELCVPLVSGGQVLGAINAESVQPDFFSDDDERLLLTIANLLATAIQNARLFGLAQDQRNIAEALREASMALTSTLDFNEVLDGILASLGRVVPHDAANIMTLDADGRTLKIVVARGLDAFGLDEDQVKLITLDLHQTKHLRWMLDTKEPLIIADVSKDPDWLKMEGMEWLRSYLCAPILAEGTIIGFVNLESATPGFFTPAHARDLGAFAIHAGVAIENAMLYQELERHSQFLEQAVEEATGELRQSRDRIETILENSPDAVLLLKRDGTIEMCNAAFSRLFDYSESEVRGQSLSMLAVGEAMGYCNQHLNAVVEKMVTDRFEIAGENKAGVQFDAEFALAPITREGELFGVVSTIRDISALKQVERMKDAFVSNVSHELRTPITSLKLNHSLLEMNPTRSGVYLERIGREIDRLNTLIEDLLRLSRLDQGKVDLNLEQISLGVIAGEYAKDRMPLASDRKISLFLEDDAKTDLIYADPGLIGQALSVLLTNALNYTAPGGRIMVRTLERDIDGEHQVGIEVSDTGPGIDEEDLPLIFERFFRGKTGLESRAPGTGLGLAIAYEIVQEHRGTIEVDPGGDNGQGASFKLWFPALAGKSLSETAELGKSN